MGSIFFKKKKNNDKTRKLPWLPRLGIYLDIAGYEVIYKQVPALETAMNLIERGISFSQLKKIEKEQFAEIAFPIRTKKKIYQTTATTISVQKSNLP